VYRYPPPRYDSRGTRNNRSPRSLLLLYLLAAATAGCGSFATLQQSERGARLQDTLQAYSKLVRWSQFAAARRFIGRPEVAPTGTQDRSRATRPQRKAARPGASPGAAALPVKIKVTALDLESVVFNETFSEAIVTYRVAFYHEDTPRERRMNDTERWWWDDTRSR